MARMIGEMELPWMNTSNSPIDFTWNDTRYHLEYGYADGKAFVDLTPENPLIAERILARVEEDSKPLWVNPLDRTTELAELLQDLEP